MFTTDMTITLITDYGTTVAAPGKYEVCPRCLGRGVHDAWEGGMTGAEMAEQGPEFAQDYADGMYSVACTECAGKRVVLVLDEERAAPELVRLYEEAQLADFEAEQTYRMESGSYLMGL